MSNSPRRLLSAIVLLGTFTLVTQAGTPASADYFGTGLSANWNGKNEEAIADFTKAIALEPKYTLAYCNRAAAYQNSGNFELALADCNKAIELAPRYSGCYLMRGGVYLDLHNPQKALPDFNIAIELRPLAITFYRRGETYFALGQYDMAIQDFTHAISPHDLPEPQNPDPLDNMTVAIDLEKELPYYYRALAQQRLRQFTDAEANFTKAAESDPDVSAQLAKTTGHGCNPPTLAQAVKAYSGALEEEPSDDGAYFDPNRAGFAGHNFGPAVATLNSLLRLYPGDTQARIDRGYAEFKLNDFEHSLGDASTALNYNSNNPDAFNNRALTYLTTGQYDHAIDDYKMVIRLLLASNLSASDAAAKHRRALTYCGLGKAFGLKGDDVNAQVSFNLAIKTAPDLAIVYRFRGDYEMAMGKDDCALADYSNAIQLNPQSSEAFSGRAWVLSTSLMTQLRDFPTAIEDATKACELTYWQDPDLLGVLAAACAASGDFANAVKWQASVTEITSHEPDQAANAEAERRLTLYRGQKPYVDP